MAEQPPPPPDDRSARPPAETGWVDARAAPIPPGNDPTGYLRANAGRYTRDALTSRLTSAGHTRHAIDAAWATIDREDAASGRRDRRGQVSRLIGGAYLLTWLGLTLAWLASNIEQPGPVITVSGLLGAVLLLPGLLGYSLSRGSRRLRRADAGTAVAFAVLPLLILVALAGTCAAIVPPFGGIA